LKNKQIFIHAGVASLDHVALVSNNFVERGRTAHFIVSYDPALGSNGPILADAVLGSCEADYGKLQA
jgi:hypothetical protein